MQYHHSALIALHDFPGHAFRHNLVVIVHENDGQTTAGQLVHHGVVHEELLDLLVMDKLVGGFTPAAIQAIGFHQLADLGLDGFFLSGALSLQIKLAIPFGFFFPCLRARTSASLTSTAPLGCCLLFLRFSLRIASAFFSSARPAFSNWSCRDAISNSILSLQILV
jgi:hypothetical protein